MLCLLLAGDSQLAAEGYDGMNNSQHDNQIARVELINWRLDEILLYESPDGDIIGKIIFERHYPSTENQKFSLMFMDTDTVDYLITLRGENVDFRPYAVVDGAESQHFQVIDRTKNGGTVTVRGGYTLQMRLIGPFGEWSEVIIDETTNRTAYLKTLPDFRVFRLRYEF